MAWTSVAKPSTNTFVQDNFQGKQIYDQADLSYDGDTYYDSYNPSQWTDIAKPSGAISVSIVPGMATGLTMPVTYSTTYSFTSDLWTRINKPS